MPLSEQEQRLLDEMERQLMHNDADVVHTGAERTFSYRNMLIGALLVLLGLGAVIAGIALWNIATVGGVVAGVLGFAAMVGGVILALSPGKGQDSTESGPDRSPRSPQSTPSNASFIDKMNDRWDRRQQG
ncbi:DUF3040 domain-containing protein [Microbacterium sp. G2-8]|uniref:DUF3040 domain-containing protein n=1 Tax=Microbacterium sp. G2-8 TaxID=2842454 RepID=UPI001C899522|nr:DUF3040 domain-containing protein [Microbacterium sp. G2-8]